MLVIGRHSVSKSESSPVWWVEKSASESEKCGLDRLKVRTIKKGWLLEWSVAGIARIKGLCVIREGNLDNEE